MKPSEFAKLVGASRQAVSKACATKRLDRSVTRDPQGRVVDIDPGMGDAGWWLAVLAALNAAVDPKVPAEDLPAMWEASGRAAVAAARGNR